MITLQDAEDYLKAADVNGWIETSPGVRLRTKKDVLEDEIFMEYIGAGSPINDSNWWLTFSDGSDPIGINNAHDLMMILK